MSDEPFKAQTVFLAVGMIGYVLWGLIYWAAHAGAVVFGLLALFNWDAEWAKIAGILFIAAIACRLLSYVLMTFIGWKLGPPSASSRE